MDWARERFVADLTFETACSILDDAGFVAFQRKFSHENYKEIYWKKGQVEVKIEFHRFPLPEIFAYGLQNEAPFNGDSVHVAWSKDAHRLVELASFYAKLP